MEKIAVDRTIGFILVGEFLLGLVPVIVLGAAIGWPASLAFPPETILPLIQNNIDQVRLGYGFYLLYSVLFFPIVVLVARGLVPNGQFGTGLMITFGFAALSTLARAVGILRWLVPIPVLADLHGSALAGGSVQETVSVVFVALNSYGGAVGEQFGVFLFAGLALLGLGFYLISRSGIPRWLGWSGMAVGVVQILGFLGTFGVPMRYYTIISTVSLLFWFLAVGLRLMVSKKSGRLADNPA